MGKLDVEEYGTYDSMVATLLEHKFLPEKEVLQLCERAQRVLTVVFCGGHGGRGEGVAFAG